MLSLFAKREEQSASHILILSNTAMGDTLWATPALRYLADTKPDTKITILTSKIGSEVFKRNPFITQVLISGKLSTNFKNIITIINTPFSETFNFHTAKRLEAYYGYLGSPRRYFGIYPECKGKRMLNDGIHSPEFESLHKIDMRILLLQRFLNLPPPKKQYRIEVFPNQTDQKVATKALKNIPVNKMVFIQPGASFPSKCWDPQNFAYLIKWLDDREYHCIFAGNAREEVLIDSITKGCKHVIKLGSRYSLLELAEILKQCRFIITNDTGPMHLAEAVNLPIFSFFWEENIIPAKPLITNYCKIYSTPSSKTYMSQPTPNKVISDICYAIENKLI